MSTPIHELDALKLDAERKKQNAEGISPTSDDGTFVTDGPAGEGRASNNDRHLRVNTDYEDDGDFDGEAEGPPMRSPSQAREQAMRLDDDLALLQAERVASRSTHEDAEEESKPASVNRSRSRRRAQQPVDEFDEATNPLHEKAAMYNPPEDPHTNVAKFIKKLHNSSFIIRYFTYIVPVVVLLLIPLLLGAFVFYNANVGGVRLLWFSVWLEIVWLTLWAGRVRSFSQRVRLTGP